MGVRGTSNIKIVRSMTRPLSESAVPDSRFLLRQDFTGIDWNFSELSEKVNKMTCSILPTRTVPGFHRRFRNNMLLVIGECGLVSSGEMGLYYNTDPNARYRIGKKNGILTAVADYKGITLGIRVATRTIELYKIVNDGFAGFKDETERFETFLRTIMNDPHKFNELPF